MSSLSDGDTNKQLRWFVGVPLGTNPLILVDLVTVLAIAWGVSFLALLLLQFALGGYLAPDHLGAAADLSSYLTLVFVALYLVICFFIMRNHYAALYRFDSSGIYCENMRAHPRALDKALFRFRAYPIEPQRESIRSVEKRAGWRDVTRVQQLKDLRVLILKGKRGTLMRVYCPDDHIFNEALAFIQEKTVL